VLLALGLFAVLATGPAWSGAAFVGLGAAVLLTLAAVTASRAYGDALGGAAGRLRDAVRVRGRRRAGRVRRRRPGRRLRAPALAGRARAAVRVGRVLLVAALGAIGVAAASDLHGRITVGLFGR
jgi:hypothetical protein